VYPQDNTDDSLVKQIESLVAIAGGDNRLTGTVTACFGALYERCPVAVGTIGKEAGLTGFLTHLRSVIVEETIGN
jgi:hypothetical protein